MRVVIKPWGLAVLLTALFVLVALPIVLLRGRGGGGTAPPAAGTRKPVVSGGKSVPAAAGLPASPSGNNLLREENWRFYTERTARAFQEALPDAPARPAYRFSVEQSAGQDWFVGFNNKLRGVSLRAGEKVRLRFHARSASRNTIAVLLQKDAAPYPHSWKKYVRLEPGWKEYEFTVPSAAYADGEGLLAFFFGMTTGKIDLAGVRLERE